MMSLKWTGGGAPIQGLQDRCVHFQKALLIQKFPQSRECQRPLPENVEHIRIHCQICIALAGLELRILQLSMPDNAPVCQSFILVRRQRADSLGEHLEVMNVQGDLSGFGAEHDPGGLDEVPNIEHLIKEVHPLLSQFVCPEE